MEQENAEVSGDEESDIDDEEIEEPPATNGVEVE
jgi:hypothetical protein